MFLSVIDDYLNRLDIAATNEPGGGGSIKYNAHIRYNAHVLYESDEVDYPILYNEVDRTLWLHEPNLVRWRHRFRGVRESLKMNQEIGQTIYDLHILQIRRDGVSDIVEILWDDHEFGVEFAGVSVGEDDGITIPGIFELAARTDSASKKIRIQEKG